MSIKQLVNTKKYHDALTKEFEQMIALRHATLEQVSDHQEISRLQGEIRVLRRLLRLKEIVNARDKSDV